MIKQIRLLFFIKSSLFLLSYFLTKGLIYYSEEEHTNKFVNELYSSGSGDKRQRERIFFITADTDFNKLKGRLIHNQNEIVFSKNFDSFLRQPHVIKPNLPKLSGSKDIDDLFEDLDYYYLNVLMAKMDLLYDQLKSYNDGSYKYQILKDRYDKFLKDEWIPFRDLYDKVSARKSLYEIINLISFLKKHQR